MAELKIAFSIVCNILIAYTSVFLNLCNTHELLLLSEEVRAKGFHLCSELWLHGLHPFPVLGISHAAVGMIWGSHISRTVNIPF